MAGDRLAIAHDRDIRIDFGDTVAGRFDFGATHVADPVEDLALQVGDVDLVKVNDAQLPDTGGGQIDGGRAAQPTGANEQHLAVEEFDLPLFANVVQDRVAAVANALLGGQNRGHLERQSRVLPAAKSADERVHIGVPHLLQIAGGKRRSYAAGTVDHQWLRAVRLMLLYLQLQVTARHKCCVGDVSLHPFIALAYIDERHRLVVVDPFLHLVDGDLLDLALCQSQQLVPVESCHDFTRSRQPSPAQLRSCRPRQRSSPARPECEFRRRCGIRL